MFTLFKPWRKATDLKNANETWPDAFKAYEFSVKEKHLMDNFNLIYECNDACDDYSAQLHSKEQSSERISDEFLEDPFYENLDHPWASEKYKDNQLEPFFDDDPFLPYYHKIKDMQQVSQKVVECGWIDTSQQVKPIDLSNDWYVSPDNINATDWKNLVQQTKQGLLQQTKESISSYNHCCV